MTISPLDLERFETLVSPQFGVFSNVSFHPVSTGGPKVFWATVKGKSHQNLKIQFVGSGVSIDRETALVSALGEAVERYSAGNHGQLRIYRNLSFKQILATGEKALSPMVFNVFTAAQYRSVDFKIPEFSNETEIDWVEGFLISDRSKILVPAAMAFWGFDGDPRSCSSGLSCSTSVDDAILRGLLELVERDAFAFTWWTKTQWDEIDLGRVGSQELRELFISLGPWARALRVFSTTLDHGIECIFCVYMSEKNNGERNKNEPAFLVSGAAGLDIRRSILKAVTECAEVYLGQECEKQESQLAQRLALNSTSQELDWDKNIQTFKDGVSLYASGQYDEFYSFLLAPRKIRELKEDFFFPFAKFAKFDSSARFQTSQSPITGKSDDLSAVLGALQRIGSNPIAVELTTRDIRQSGLHVLRVIAPELIPINAAHKYRPIGHPRLNNLWQNLRQNLRQKLMEGDQIGELSVDLSGESLPLELNSMPHPFP